MPIIYLSKANNIPDKIRNKAQEIVIDFFGSENVTMHNGGVYDESKLSNSDVVIVIEHPDHKLFVGKGVYSEINTALYQKKPLFLLKFEKDDYYSYNEIISAEIYDIKNWTNKHASITLGRSFNYNQFDTYITNILEGEIKNTSFSTPTPIFIHDKRLLL